MKPSRVRGKGKKRPGFRTFFVFQIFKTSENLEIYFRISVRKYLCIAISNFEVLQLTAFWLKFWHTIKQAPSSSLQCCYPFWSYLSQCWECVFFLIYTISISILCVSEEGVSLVESNQQRDVTCTSEQFLKTKDIRDLSKVNFLYQQLVISL